MPPVPSDADPRLDPTAVDHALTTTRAVRRRLDLERPVDDQIIFDCIDVAEQAPTGGNQGSRRWVIVRDPEVKQRLAELYMATGGEWMIGARDRLSGSGHPQEKVMESAAHLAEHLAEVPAIVIPTIIGRHDGSGQPGLFDSVIQSVWSFCVALRARGLGTAWTTAVLQRRDDLAALLGVPDGNTQIAMIPVAWTKGTDFRRAPRHPARDIVFVDHYGHTWARGPGDPPSVDDGPGAVVEVDIDAPAFGLALCRRRRFRRAVQPGAAAGELGRRHHRAQRRRDVHGIERELVHRRMGRHLSRRRVRRARSFAWSTVDPDVPGATWRYDLEHIAGATRLRHSVVIGPGPSGLRDYAEAEPDAAPAAIAGRMENLRTNMQAVVDGIKATVEQR